MIETDIPLYGAAFDGPESVVIAGGGGEGNHGIPNKLIQLNLAGEYPEISKEYVLPKGSDCPMSIASLGSKLVIGANSAAGEKENLHLQVFDGLEPKERASVFDREYYQRFTTVCESKYAILAASDASDSVVHVLDAETLGAQWKLEVSSDARDLSFSLEGRLLAVVLPRKVTFYESGTGKAIYFVDAPANGKFLRGKFLSETKFVSAVHDAAKKVYKLQTYIIEDEPMLTSETNICTKSNVTALAVNEHTITVGTAAGDVLIYNERLSNLHCIKSAHKLPVSGLVIGPTGVIISVSVAGTVHIAKPPFSSRSLFSHPVATIGCVAVALAILVLSAALLFSRLQRDTMYTEEMAIETVYETVFEVPTATVYETAVPHVQQPVVEQEPTPVEPDVAEAAAEAHTLTDGGVETEPAEAKPAEAELQEDHPEL